MSTAAAATTQAAAKHIAKNVTSSTHKPAPLLRYVFEPHPKRINCCTYGATRTFAEEADHPLHIRTKRRLANFDPNTLHWTVKCPLELSKKAVVRNWAVRRVKQAFLAQLKSQGWDKNGRSVALGEAGTRMALKGALCMRVNKDKGIIEASGEDVRRSCSWVLRKVVEAQRNGNGNGNAFRRVIDEPVNDTAAIAAHERTGTIDAG